MAILEIIGGILLILVVVGLLIATFADANLVWLGAGVIVALGAAYLLDLGWRHENVRFHAKHVAILRDLRADGYSLGYRDVNARGGWYYLGTEADLDLGGCRVPFIAARVGGRWRLALKSAETGPSVPDVRVLTRRDVAKIAEACS